MIFVMKGLEEYIKVHGNHFTEELASVATDRRWNTSKVTKAAQDRVYYNVTGSTSGDMVYLMDMAYSRLNSEGRYSHNKGISMMLSWVGDYQKTGSPFCIWLTVMLMKKKDFDFTPYI